MYTHSLFKNQLQGLGVVVYLLIIVPRMLWGELPENSRPAWSTHLVSSQPWLQARPFFSRKEILLGSQCVYVGAHGWQATCTRCPLSLMSHTKAVDLRSSTSAHSHSHPPAPFPERGVSFSTSGLTSACIFHKRTALWLCFKFSVTNQRF